MSRFLLLKFWPNWRILILRIYYLLHLIFKIWFYLAPELAESLFFQNLLQQQWRFHRSNPLANLASNNPPNHQRKKYYCPNQPNYIANVILFKTRWQDGIAHLSCINLHLGPPLVLFFQEKLQIKLGHTPFQLFHFSDNFVFLKDRCFHLWNHLIKFNCHSDYHRKLINMNHYHNDCNYILPNKFKNWDAFNQNYFMYPNMGRIFDIIQVKNCLFHHSYSLMITSLHFCPHIHIADFCWDHPLLFISQINNY